MKVGYIGLGNIGGAMAEQLTQAPYELTVYDVSAAAMQVFEGKAALAASPAEVGRAADIIGICVRDEADTRAVLSGPSGLLAGIKPGALILVHSTLSPAAAVSLAAQAAQAGATLLDAAVTGAAEGARARSICTMVGGDAAQVDRARGFLQAFSSKVTHAGPVGSGMALKLCNNLVFFMQVQAVFEGFKLAEAGGMSPALREVMTENGNLTKLTQLFVDFQQHGQKKLGEEGFKRYNQQMCGLAEKDLDLALEHGRAMGLELRGAEAARALMRSTFGV